jgi:hypothetical protein
MSGLCRHCGGPILRGADGVWRHQAESHDGIPLLTRWCLDGNGDYIWPTQHAGPASDLVGPEATP